MGFDIVQMLAEPGRRQLLIAGSAAAAGVVKRFWTAYHVGRLQDPMYKLRASLEPTVYNADVESTKRKERWFKGLAWGVPAAAGLEEAIRSSTPIAENYIAEGTLDVTAGFVGYHVGDKGIALVVSGIGSGIKSVKNLRKKKVASKKKINLK